MKAPVLHNYFNAKKVILLTISFFVAELAFSQTDFRKGYLITNDRDTLFGMVDYREGNRSYYTCDFRNSKDGNAVSYEPADISGYGFENDKFFQSKEVKLKERPSSIVFLEAIVKSDLVSLYEYESTYFIEKEKSGAMPLINETEEVTINGQKALKNSNQHVATLSMLLFDCPEIRGRIQNARLTEKYLSRLVEDYNRFKGKSSTTYKAQKSWARATIGLTTGLNISQLSFKHYVGYEYLTGDFEVSNSPIFGISLNLASPRISERISFRSDVLYLESDYYKYSESTFSTSIKRNYVTIELQSLKIPIGFQYTFPNKKFTPYLNVGISGTKHLSSDSEWIQEVEGIGGKESFTAEALEIKKGQLGIWGGFGITTSISKKLNTFLELRYEHTDGVSQSVIHGQKALQSDITNIQLFIGIRSL